jgi:hypothetical protein
MKRITVILLLTGIYLVFCSKSCNDAAKRDQKAALLAVQAAKDSILTVSPCFSSPNLTLLGEEARLLCSDIADYLNIVADTSLAQAFRQQARRMVLEGFLTETMTIRLRAFKGPNPWQAGQTGENKTSTGRNTDPTGMTVLEYPLIKLLDESDSSFRGILISKPDNIWIAEPLKQLSDTLFEGSLGYRTHPKGKTATTGRYYTYPGNGFMDFYAIRTVKIFGHDTLKVWSVRLGENRYNKNSPAKTNP